MSLTNLKDESMKKTLIAAAVLATSAAYAQSSVEVYGLLEMSVVSSKETLGNDVTKKRATAAEGTDSQGRIGFRGTEDLGSGLKASFVLETGVGGTLADRLANLSLSSDMGTVTLGKFWNAFDDATTGLGLGDAIVGISNMPTKATNGIAYTSPEFSGFTFGLGYSQVSEKTNGVKTGNDRVSEVSVSYAAGPLAALLVHGQVKAEPRTDGDKVYQDAKLKGTALKVSYDLGFAVPYVMYARDTDKTGAFTDDGILQSNSTGNKSRGYEIGASFPMGAFTPFVTLASANSRSSSDGVSAADRTKTRGSQIGVTYDLSKRTSAFAVAGRTKQKTAGVTEEKFSQTAVGLLHTF